MKYVVIESDRGGAAVSPKISKPMDMRRRAASSMD